MRAPIPTLFALGVVTLGAACASRTRADAAPAAPEAVAGSAGDPCAVYIERVTAGVRCEAVDDRRCSCEMVADAGEASAPVVLDTQTGAGPTPASTGDAAPKAAPVATLEFAPGPPNTIVQCTRGPCPTRSADFITEPHAPIALPASGASIELEFRAPGHKRLTQTYALKPGKNYIEYALTPTPAPGPPNAAKLQFDAAPQGLTIECLSGPCPDHKLYPADRFPELPMTAEEATVLFMFRAPGYRDANTSYQIRRGPNLIPVVMERAPLAK